VPVVTARVLVLEGFGHGTMSAKERSKPLGAMTPAAKRYVTFARACVARACGYDTAAKCVLPMIHCTWTLLLSLTLLCPSHFSWPGSAGPATAEKEGS